MTIIQETKPRMIAGREYNFRTGHDSGRQHCRTARPPLVDAGSLPYQDRRRFTTLLPVPQPWP